jgi:hypothetical protein
MKITLVKVTPELATLWLEKNENNRRVRPSVVPGYARDMAAGRWDVNGETIKFDVNGVLLDGQHRLMAVLMAGVPVEMLVVTGLPPEARETVDAGVARTAADVLSMRDVPHAALQAAAARLSIIIESGSSNLQTKITHGEIREWITDHPELVESVYRTEQVRKYVRGCRPSLAVYADFELAKVNTEAAKGFWHAAATLEAEYDGDPAVALSRRFADVYVHRQQLGDLETLSLIYRAWNKRRRYEKSRVIKVLPARTLDDLPKLKR